MNPNIKAQWIEALLGGKYRQGTETLKRLSRTDGAPSYCCLGVLCDLHDPTQWTEPDLGTGQHSYGGRYLTGMPAFDVLDWAGVGESHAHRLAEMNDQGSSFASIADYIEANL